MPEQPTTNPLTSGAFDEYDTVTSRADTVVRNGVRTVAARAAGEAGFTERALYPGDPYPSQAVQPEAEIMALVRIRAAAEGQLYYAVCGARGAGASWARVAELIGLEENNGHMTLDERAYDYFVPRDTFGHNTFSFTCSTCGEQVKDRGPFEPHPADNEEGHAAGCARLAAAITAYRAARGD